MAEDHCTDRQHRANEDSLEDIVHRGAEGPWAQVEHDRDDRILVYGYEPRRDERGLQHPELFRAMGFTSVEERNEAAQLASVHPPLFERLGRLRGEGPWRNHSAIEEVTPLRLHAAFLVDVERQRLCRATVGKKANPTKVELTIGSECMAPAIVAIHRFLSAVVTDVHRELLLEFIASDRGHVLRTVLPRPVHHIGAVKRRALERREECLHCEVGQHEKHEQY
mmetsp:Transcript_57230/g.159281  ORF Transcript_57230/g.159281 Transcript_57230/m.159281 type:complete len:223 (-) Transcript_57230:167-835(-)